MNRLTEKQLLILTISVAVVLSGGLGFLIWSDLKTIDEEEGKIEALRTQIAGAEREVALIPQREFRAIANREIAAREVAFLPELSEIEEFWNVLERYASESGVQISEIAPSNAGRRRKKKKTSIRPIPQVMSLRGTADEFLRFINAIENHDRIINVVEYSIKAGEAPDSDGQLRHGIKLALTTFTYSKKIASTIVSIQKYEKKREHARVKQWLSRIKIQEKESYTLRTSLGRRDPFVTVRKRPVRTPVDAGTGEQDRARQERMLQNLVDQLQTLSEGLVFQKELQEREDLWRLQEQIKENRALYRQLAEQIESARQEIRIPELQERLRAEVLEPFEAIKKNMAAIADANPRMSEVQVRAHYDKLAKHFDEGEWDLLEQGVREFLEQSRKGQHVDENAKAMVAQIYELQRKGRVIRDFEKRKVSITTILYSPDGMSVAVINGRQLSQEDALDPQGNIIVAEIGENYVIFETEGVEIKKAQG